MTNKTITKISLSLLLLMLAQTSVAGTIYRFVDKNGSITMSKSLPPYASQNGYDILNDSSLRLIKRVAPALTPEQIAEKEHLEAERIEQERLAKIAEEQKMAEQKQQSIHDQALVASYGSEHDLIKARDDEFLYLNAELEKAKTHLGENKQKLEQLQQKAAQQELSGQTISDLMKKQMSAAQEEINNDKHNISELTARLEQTELQYEKDLARLKVLMNN